MLCGVAALLPCLVVGCGYLGTRFARAVVPRRAVLALLRSPGRAADLRVGGLDARCMDLDTTPPALPRDLAEAAHGAAVVYLVPPPDRGTTDPRIAAFLHALGAATPAVFVYVSTTGVYGDTGGAPVDERSPLAPANDRSRRRLAAEHVAASWCAARDVRCVVLRVPGIYGPHRLPLERLGRGEPALRPEDAGPGNRIHVDDLVAALVAAIDRPQAHGAYNVVDGDHASTTAYLQETARAAGLPPPALVTRAEAPARIPAGMLDYLLESRRVDNRRMLDELGVRLRYPSLGAGVHANLAEMHTEQPSS